MKKLVLILLGLLGTLLTVDCGGGGGGTDGGDDSGIVLCDLTEHPCPAGQRCNRDQECVIADPLRITTDSLPDGRINFPYSQKIDAAGGLPPYSWAITQAGAGLEFLSINSSGTLSGTTTQPVEGASITIAVSDDGYGGGETASKAFTLSFSVCKENDTELCYTPKNGACYQGYRICHDGQMGDCQAGDNPSQDRRQCGPDCSECDGSTADGCLAGLCACGTGLVCGGGQRCCAGSCLDVSDNIQNCGGCGADCTDLVGHASGAAISCSGGVCDYAGDCDYGWLDCDARRDNGCEQAVGPSNCGECGRDCRALVTHVPTDDKICRDFTTYYECDYDGACNEDFGDCDAERYNGCETYLNNALHCDACGNDCSAVVAGHLCLTLDPDPYLHTCGCNYNSAEGTAEGCDAGQICCEHACEDPIANADHCGVCRAACAAGYDCVNAACGCASSADCPSPSSATTCQGSRCVCAEAGNLPCPASRRFCCDGQAGGSGGPNEEADIGCCPKTCGQNSVDYPCAQ